ncbi:S24 family peptidase [Thiohalorhabdus sp. Cl-TMA]|uniref:Helix-turn-helix transcriptional regulator n=1 Tax=Thiohalorhabdus methylotrophus TaxID=3242694 RepID=A0ABV4TXX0_9GAMM
MSASAPPPPENAAQSLLQGLGERITRIAEMTGGKRKLAAAAGIRESQLFRYIRGDNLPSLAAAAALAEAGGVSLEWLAYGRLPDTGPEESGIAEPPGGYGAGDDWVAVPLHNHGASPLSFRRAWLRDLGLEPASLLLAEVPDDAMMPTFQPRDLVLADTRANRVEAAGLYLFRLEDLAVPRRAVPAPDGSLRLQSDNTLYPEMHVSGQSRSELRVLGRIAWAGRRF